MNARQQDVISQAVTNYFLLENALIALEMSDTERARELLVKAIEEAWNIISYTRDELVIMRNH